MHKHLLAILFCLAIHNTHAQEPKRKIFMGAFVHQQDTLLVVDSVAKNSTASALGLQTNDIITAVDNFSIKNMNDYVSSLSDKRADDKISISIIRNKKTISKKGIAVERPLAKTDWATIEYGWLPAAACTLRTIVYKPKENKKQYPAVLFIPGYNCGTIETYLQNFNGKLIEHWVKAGYMVYTVEKSGNGDSYGCIPCIDVDLKTDIEFYETAYEQLANRQDVQQNNLFIWGHSMGGIIAPMMRQNTKAKGIMVFGTVFRPWSEFLLEMHRVQKPLLDSLTFEQAETFTRLIQKVYYEFFILKKSPKQLYQNPEYKSIVASELEYKEGNEQMWGRHWRFWQQLDSINLAKAWQETPSNVLVLHGNADYIQCSAVEPYLILEAVNQKHPGKARMKIMEGVDHLITNSKDFHEAVKNFNNKEFLKNNFYQPMAEETIKWMDELRRQ